jgi:hypothetical protein
MSFHSRKLKKIWRGLTGRRKPWARASRARRALAEVAKFPRYNDSPRHGLPAPLIVSLTSYPPRFPYLQLTLKSLLDQTVRPDKIVLWIAHADLAQLPETVSELAGELLDIRTCEDLRNFKRLVPAIEEFPDSFIIFVDDDIFYPAQWLERMVRAYDPRDPAVVCYRASRIGHNADGSLTPYRTWPEAVDRKAERPSVDLLPINQMGVLYPPGSLPQQTKDYSLIQKLSPTSDEVWLFFMWRLAGWRAKRVPGQMPDFAEWPGSQEQALWRMHRGGTKDEHFRAMSEHFGNA